MILPDVNLLLYAYNPYVPQHSKAHEWWERSVNGDELIALPYEVIFGFIRIATNPRIGAAAVSLVAAREVTQSWQDLPQIRTITPSARHFEHVMTLMEEAMATGAVLSDAILAAYAIEHRARLCTNDADFSRFRGLEWENPLSA